MAGTITEILECRTCKEPFDELDRKPKILPCYHTFCLSCLRLITTADITHLWIICPYDSRKFEVPDADVDQFSNDFTMMSLLEKTKNSDDDDGDIKRVLSQRVEARRIENFWS